MTALEYENDDMNALVKRFQGVPAGISLDEPALPHVQPYHAGSHESAFRGVSLLQRMCPWQRLMGHYSSSLGVSVFHGRTMSETKAMMIARNVLTHHHGGTFYVTDHPTHPGASMVFIVSNCHIVSALYPHNCHIVSALYPHNRTFEPLQSALFSPVPYLLAMTSSGIDWRTRVATMTRDRCARIVDFWGDDIVDLDHMSDPYTAMHMWELACLYPNLVDANTPRDVIDVLWGFYQVWANNVRDTQEDSWWPTETQQVCHLDHMARMIFDANSDTISLLRRLLPLVTHEDIFNGLDDDHFRRAMGLFAAVDESRHTMPGNQWQPWRNLLSSVVIDDSHYMSWCAPEAVDALDYILAQYGVDALQTAIEIGAAIRKPQAFVDAITRREIIDVWRYFAHHPQWHHVPAHITFDMYRSMRTRETVTVDS